MKNQLREEAPIVAAAERQMRTYVQTQEIEDRAESTQIHFTHQRHGISYIAISREFGSGGAEVATQLGSELGWAVLNKDLLSQVAERYGLSRPMLELVDETRDNWLYDIFGNWIDQSIVSHDKYFAYLRRVMRAAAKQGKVIIVGRGAQFMLPRDDGLAVRIVAPREYRIKEIMHRNQCTQSEAERMVTEVDYGRRRFVRRYFRRDISDPHLYDLVINTEHLGIMGAVRQIVAMMVLVAG